MFSLSLGAGLRLTPRTGAARRGGAFAYSRLLHPLLYSDTQHVRPRFRVRRRCERQRTGHKHHGRQRLGRRCQPRAVAGGLQQPTAAVAQWRRRLEQLIVAEVGRQLGQQRWPHAAAPRAAALTCVGGGNVGERRVELCSAGGAQPKLSTSAANAADTLPCDAGARPEAAHGVQAPLGSGGCEHTCLSRAFIIAPAATESGLTRRQHRCLQQGRS